MRVVVSLATKVAVTSVKVVLQFCMHSLDRRGGDIELIQTS